jgi:hypothetical protein
MLCRRNGDTWNNIRMRFKRVLALFLLTLTSAHAYTNLPPLCSGAGGIKVKTDNESFKYLYREMKHTYSCSGGEVSPQMKTIDEYEDKIEKLFDEIEKFDGCYDLSGIKRKYEINLKENQEKHERNIKRFKGSFPKQDMNQPDYFIWAQALSMCTAAKVSWKVSDYWKLKLDLNNVEDLGEAESITENDGVASSCRNVYVSGSEDLETFYVKTADALDGKIKIKYNAFMVPDQFKVSQDGKDLHDSGCVGGLGEVEEELPVSTGKEDKVKIGVKSKCDGSDGTFWTIHITCRAKPKDIEFAPECISKFDELKTTINEAIENKKKVLDRFWIEAMCHRDVYGQFVDFLLNYDDAFIEIGERTKKHGQKYTPLKRKEFSSYSSNMRMNRNPSSLPKHVEDSASKGIGDGFAPTYRNMVRNGSWHNKNRCPSDDDVKDSLFATVTKAYCDHGYDRLFGKN